MDYRYNVFKVKPIGGKSIERLVKEFNNGSDAWNATSEIWEQIISNNTKNVVPSIEGTYGEIGPSFILKVMRTNRYPKFIFYLDNYNADTIVTNADQMYEKYRTKELDKLIKFDCWTNPIPWIGLNRDRIIVSSDSSSDNFTYTHFGNKAYHIDIEFEVEKDKHARLHPLLMSDETRAVYLFGKKKGFELYDFYLVLKVNSNLVKEIPLMRKDKESAVSIVFTPDTDYVYQKNGDTINTDSMIQMYPDTKEYASELAYKIISTLNPKRIIIPDMSTVANFPLNPSTGCPAKTIDRYMRVRYYLTKYGTYFNVPVYTMGNYSYMNCKFKECGSGTLELTSKNTKVECKECDYTRHLVDHVLDKLVNIDVHKKSDEAIKISNRFDSKFYLRDNPIDAIPADWMED